jgi:hypothetical protein
MEIVLVVGAVDNVDKERVGLYTGFRPPLAPTPWGSSLFRAKASLWRETRQLIHKKEE